mgnify:CR=1 FL=1
MSATNVISEVAASAAEPNVHGVMDVSGTLMVWTWVTFAIVAFLLYKIAWKPILSVLASREERIRRSLAEAEEAHATAINAEAQRQDVLEKARTEAQTIINAARASAVDHAKTIEQQARDEARQMVANAAAEIGRATEHARRELRQTSAALAVELAAKVIDEQVDPARQRTLADQLIRELQP